MAQFVSCFYSSFAVGYTAKLAIEFLYCSFFDRDSLMSSKRIFGLSALFIVTSVALATIQPASASKMNGGETTYGAGRNDPYGCRTKIRNEMGAAPGMGPNYPGFWGRVRKCVSLAGGGGGAQTAPTTRTTAERSPEKPETAKPKPQRAKSRILRASARQLRSPNGNPSPRRIPPQRPPLRFNSPRRSSQPTLETSADASPWSSVTANTSMSPRCPTLNMTLRRWQSRSNRSDFSPSF
jgi:hypothetical protein